MVAKLRELSRFKDVVFVALPADQRERWEELKAIDGRAAFIWGDGFSHHDSYYFTCNTAIQLKVNIDAHPDWSGRCMAIRALTGKVVADYAGHMDATEFDGVKIIVPNEVHELKEADLRWIVERITYSREVVALTIDCDVIPNFPTRRPWVFEDGIGASHIIAMVNAVRGRVLRLDVGGMVEGVSEFDFIIRERLIIPTLEETRAVAMAKDPIYSKRPQPPADILNRVCSHAFWIYADILAAFFGVDS
jgi:hypothetical protein